MTHEKSTMGRIFARMLLISSFLFMVVMNILANTGVFNHTTVDKVSAEYETRITPEGYAFSIWGLIWAFVAIFVIYFTVKRSAIDSLHWFPIGAFVVNCVACGLWTMLFCYRMILTAFFDIVIVWATTAYLYKVFYPKHTSAFSQLNGGYWCRGVSWSLLLGWISVAMLVNLYCVIIYYHGASSKSASDAISIIFLAAAGVVGLVATLLHDDILLLLTLLWAMIAIAVRHSQDELVFITSLIIGGAFLGLFIATVVRHCLGRGRKPTAEYTNITSPKYVPGGHI